MSRAHFISPQCSAHFMENSQKKQKKKKENQHHQLAKSFAFIKPYGELTSTHRTNIDKFAISFVV